MGKIDLCCYSGYKIYPGHGRTLVKGDGKSYKFLSSRTHKAHMLKRNPRKITWTVLYRRKHKKGLEEDVTKKRTRRAQKFQRAVVGATFRTSWRRGTRSLRCEKPRESRLCAPLRIRRRPPSRSPLSRTRPRRRPRRQQRTLPRPDPAALAASDKYFAVEFLWQFIQ